MASQSRSRTVSHRFVLSIVVLVALTGAARAARVIDAASQYAGLGATRFAFKASNNTVAGSKPLPGVAVYRIDKVSSAGRVMAYDVQVTARPPMSNRERMFLAEGINLPIDARQIVERSTCHVWRSKKLMRLVGELYARVTTTSGSDRAHAQATSNSRC